MNGAASIADDLDFTIQLYANGTNLPHLLTFTHSSIL